MSDGTERDLELIVVQNATGEFPFGIYDAVSEKLLFSCNSITAITSEGETTYTVTVSGGSDEIGKLISEYSDQLF